VGILLNHVVMTRGSACLIVVFRGQLKGKIEEVVQFIVGECLHCSGNEFLIDTTLAGLYPVYLAYRYAHGLGYIR